MERPLEEDHPACALRAGHPAAVTPWAPTPGREDSVETEDLGMVGLCGLGQVLYLSALYLSHL